MVGAAIVFRQTPALTVTADYVDFTTGEATKIFYGLTTETSSTKVYLLSDKPDLHSANIDSTGTTTQGDFAKVIDVTFDKLFTRATLIDGTAYLNISVSVGSSGAAQVTHMYVKAKLQSWDGSTATDLSDLAQSPTVDALSSSHKQQRMNLPLVVASKIIPAGDFLRLLVEGWTLNDSGGGGQGLIGHDPKSRDSTDTTNWPNNTIADTTLLLQVPFKQI